MRLYAFPRINGLSVRFLSIGISPVLLAISPLAISSETHVFRISTIPPGTSLIIRGFISHLSCTLEDRSLSFLDLRRVQCWVALMGSRDVLRGLAAPYPGARILVASLVSPLHREALLYERPATLVT